MTLYKMAGYILIVLLASSCQRKVWHTSEAETDFIRLDKYGSEADPEVEALIKPYKDILDGQMNEVIGTLDIELRKGRPESTMGNWVTDLIMEESQTLTDKKVDFAIQNYGGLRVPTIPKGELTVGKIYELMPFENYTVILTGKGETITKLFDKMAEKGGWPVSKGVSLNIKNDKATDLMINGEPFDKNKDYTFVLPDYIANGNDECEFLIGIETVSTDMLIRDLIIQYIRKKTDEGETMTTSLQKRITKS